MQSLAPIVLFVYNRPEHTRQTLEALHNNVLSDQSDLIIYADGPKENATSEVLAKIQQVRDILHENQWCRSVSVIESNTNHGLADSIISGVTDVVNKYGRVIVLEDDIVTGKHFLEYMNEALERYKDEKNIFHITGWRDPIKNAANNASYFYPKMDCWGWATWADRWIYFKKDALYYKSVFTSDMIWRFNVEGHDEGVWSQIEDNVSGKLNTWAVFWNASIFLKNGLCLAPTKSLVKNIGFDNSGEHCGKNSAQTITDPIDLKITSFPEKIEINRYEFEKNKHFLDKTHGKLLYQRLFRIIKKIFRPAYHFIKDKFI